MVRAPEGIVIYITLPANILERYARILGNTLAEEFDPAFANPVIIQGFTDFLKLVCEIKTDILNGRTKIDSSGD